MAKFVVYFLMFSNLHLILAMAQARKQVISEPALTRKLGQHYLHATRSLMMSPSESPDFSSEVSASGEETAPYAHVEATKKINHHRPIDKSVAGGGVILGGLATAFLVAIFCYIRATGRNKNQELVGSPTSSPVGRKTVDEELGSPNGTSTCCPPTKGEISEK